MILATGKKITNGGNDGVAGSANDGGGGGGGAAGSTWIRTESFAFQDATTSTRPIHSTGGAAGALSGSGAVGAAGGDGWVRIEAKTMNGAFLESSTSSFYATLHTTENMSNYGSLFVGKVDTEAADVAELYSSQEALEPGDIVSIYPEASASSRFDVNKSVRSGLRAPIGAVSTKPGLILGSVDIPSSVTTYPIALKGRTPVKVANTHGNIVRGDAITLDELAGFGSKAIGSGYIIGYALEDIDFEQSGSICPANARTTDGNEPLCGTVMTFIETGWYDPSAMALSVLSPDELSALSFDAFTYATESGTIDVSPTLRSFMQNAVAATVGFIGDLKAGRLDVLELRIGGKPLAQYIDELIGVRTTSHTQDISNYKELNASESGQLSLSTISIASSSAVVLSESTASATISSSISSIEEIRQSIESFMHSIITFFGKVFFKAPVSVPVEYGGNVYDSKLYI